MFPINLTKSGCTLKHINSITHEGKVVVFATDSEGKIWYTVKQDGFENNSLNPASGQSPGWENFNPLTLPDQSDDPSVIDRQTAECTYASDKSTFVLRCRYKTQNDSAIAPVQLVSALGHVYVFRQSMANTLFVDRFVLDGMTNTLNPKLEVRFKRSRQKYAPSAAPPAGASLSPKDASSLDALDFCDANGKNFLEPTTELCLINNLYQGWFSVVLVPTAEADVYRWHIFAYSSASQRVELTTLRASAEGLFDIKDYTLFDQDSGGAASRMIPGIIKRSFDVIGWRVNHGIAATKYDLQSEQQSPSGEQQLLKTTSRLLLAIPVRGVNAQDDDTQTAVLSFAIASDGTLAQISETPATSLIRSQQREILLPLNTLDEIRAFASAAPAPQGVITGFAMGADGSAAEDLVTIATAGAGDLANNDLVKITGSQDYQGLYSTTKIDNSQFKIQVTASSPAGTGLGFWEQKETKTTGLVFDGKITAYHKSADGELTITCPNHGLETGDSVQITGTEAYNNTYSIKRVDDTHFAIERTWPIAEGVNVKRVLDDRRGLVFDGQSTLIHLAFKEPLTEVTHELWFRTGDPEAGLFSVAFGELGATANDRHLYLAGGNLHARIYNNEVIASTGLNLADQRWHHLAHVFGKSVGGQRLYVDGQLVASGTQAVSQFDWHDRIYIGYSPDAAHKYFQGQIAEVRIWKQARSATAIRNNRYLQLTGNEVDLIGYFRLGALLEGKVLDFSRSGIVGTVQGPAYISARTLQRKLAAGQDAVKYSNPELFAVSPHNTYEESFEFRVSASTPLDLMNADGRGGRIFSFAHWGKLSRSAEEQTAIPCVQHAFTALGNGWHRASCTFTVPAEVNLARCFELTAIAGDWQSMEVRKHQVRLLSDSITAAQYVDRATLPSLGDAGGPMQVKLRQAELKERQIPALLREKRALEDRLSAYAAQASVQQEHDALAANIPGVQSEVNALDAQYQQEKASPFNYWCSIATAYNGRVFTYGSRAYFFEAFADPPTGSWDQQWAFVPAGNGDYYIQNRAHQERFCTYNFSRASYPLVSAEERGSGEQQWRVQAVGASYLITNNQHLERHCHYIYQSAYSQVAILVNDANPSTLWNLNKTADQCNTRIPDAEKTLRSKQGTLSAMQQRKAYLSSILIATPQDRAAWEARLSQVNQQISDIETEYNAINASYINDVRTANQTPQSMPQVSKDARGLSTYGAVLGFVNPISRLTALETCEGTVQLCYFDTQGRMRQTRYDVTADSRNSAFEQWLPEAQRVCLNFARVSSQLALNRPLALPAAWTLEAWFCFPFPQSARSLNSLTRGAVGGHQVMIKDGKQLGMYLPNERYGQNFYDCGYDLESLAPGWHHLAVVSKGDTARFYLNGTYVGDTKSKAKAEAKAALDRNPQDPAAKKHAEEMDRAELTFSGDIGFLGGHAPSGDLRFGKLAEVRVWGLALSPEEVAVNSRTLLSGNEPGLLAYYPMNEAAGAEVRDATGNGNTAVVSDADWCVCTAAVGRSGPEIIAFAGNQDHLPLPPKSLPSGNAVTVSFWAKGGPGLPLQTSMLLANNAKGQRVLNIHVPWTDHGVYFDCGVDDSGSYDRISKAASPAEYKGDWVHWAFTKDVSTGVMSIYRDGQLWHTGSGCRRPLAPASDLALGVNYQGSVYDVRILPVAQSQAEIQAGMIRPVFDALVCNEYSSVTVDPQTQQKSVLMRRFFAHPQGGGVTLLSDKRIETLILRWVGNAQFEPTLLGFIEGAPPIPSENLTEQYDYNGATSVELTKSQDVSYNWNRSEDIGVGGSINGFAGIEFEADAGAAFVGSYIQKVGQVRFGATLSAETNYSGQRQSSITSSSNTSLTDKLTLRGTPEQAAKFPQLGKRFIPKNVGYALVVSALADVFITCLPRSHKMIGYQIRPAENIPPDVNTITFMMNPAYTMNGSLDGLTGNRPTSDRFFKHVPDMRVQYGSQYPASYYRLQEAYALKASIEAADKQREAYFANFNQFAVDEAALEKATAAVPSEDDPIENRQKLQNSTESAITKKQKEIDTRIEDLGKRANASASFAAWQKRMENIQVLAGKRNIVNNYVWDADGGMRIETQSFANTIEHTIGGSFSISGALGIDLRVFVVIGSGELQAQGNFSLTQTMSKTLSSNTGFALNVDLSGVEYKGITDYNDIPSLPGQKVNRYRFMSFYLEGETKHYNDFFNHVVDPEWLASNSEEARALRQVKAGKPNKAWRVLHRVTYVERPALMRFGQDLRNLKPATENTETKELLSRMLRLEAKNSALEDKLDKILEKLTVTPSSGTT